MLYYTVLQSRLLCQIFCHIFLSTNSVIIHITNSCHNSFPSFQSTEKGQRDSCQKEAMFSVAKSSRFSRVVLASGSPRRKEILMNKGVCLYECIVKYSLSILALTKGIYADYSLQQRDCSRLQFVAKGFLQPKVFNKGISADYCLAKGFQQTIVFNKGIYADYSLLQRDFCRLQSVAKEIYAGYILQQRGFCRLQSLIQGFLQTIIFSKGNYAAYSLQ